MKEFTRKQRLAICEKALVELEKAVSRKWYDGLCQYLNLATINYTDTCCIDRKTFIENPFAADQLGYYMEIFFPEVAQYNPRLKDPGIAEADKWLGFWFDLNAEGAKKRIAILKKAIKQLEDESNRKKP